MVLTSDNYSRIAKLFVDRDSVECDEAQRRLRNYRIALVCGPEVSKSPTLQAAVLTAANTGARCFPGGISFHPSNSMQDRCINLPWPCTKSLSTALRHVAPSISIEQEQIPENIDVKIIFGSRPDCHEGLQVTFDGWVAAVAPTCDNKRLAEQEMCVLSGILGGALAISEAFLNFANINIEATRRFMGISLWRPDIPWNDPKAVGVPIQYLPAEFWILGLGHLGQAYVWALSLLPYRDSKEVNLIVQDFDTIIPANIDTGLLTKQRDMGKRKTRVVARWLQRRGFNATLIERAFDEGIHRKGHEPVQALCGFDGQGPRHILDQAGFDLVVECGLGGRYDNFDALSFHTLPNPSQKSSDIWPVGSGINTQFANQLASTNSFYQAFRDKYKCGHVELAGKSVAVPFVGATASSFVIAETLRVLHEGTRYENIELHLENPSLLSAILLEGSQSNRLNIRYQKIN